jgi:hypothetical protein
VDDRVRTALQENLCHARFIADVAVVKLHRSRSPDRFQIGLFGGRGVETVQVVQDEYYVLFLQQTLTDVRPDKARAACD